MKVRLWIWIAYLACGAPVSATQWQWHEPESQDSWVVDLTDDGTLMAVGTNDYGEPPGWNDFGPGAWAVLFDTGSNIPIASRNLGMTEFWVSDIAVAENGQTVAALYERELFVLDGNCELLWSRSLGPFWGNFENLDMDDAGETIAALTYFTSGGQSGPDLYVFQRDSPDELLHVGLGEGYQRGRGLAISGDGRYVAVAIIVNNVDPSIYFFDLQSAVPEQPAWVWFGEGMTAFDFSLDMSRDGSTVAAVANGLILYFDSTIPAGDKEPLWIGTGGGIGSLSQEIDLAYDGSWLVYASEYSDVGGIDHWGTVELWDGGGERAWVYEHTNQATCVRISGDGSMVAFGGNVRSVFEGQTGLIPASLGVPEYLCSAPSNLVAVSWDGRFMASSAGSIDAFASREFTWTRFHALEPNQEPECAIMEPESGQSVGGVVNVEGQALDEDGSVVRLEVETPDGWVNASDTSGGSFATWTCAVDFAAAPDGPFEICAQAVDNLGKHSELSSVTVTVDNATPAPTYTPPPWVTATPTAPPQSTATPAPTPAGDQPAYRLDLNQSVFRAGDVFLCSLEIDNQGSSCWVIECVVLAAAGQYFFYPEWTDEPDWLVRFSPGGSRFYESIVAFQVPPGAGPAGPFQMLAGLADPEHAELIGEIATVSFWFE